MKNLRVIPVLLFLSAAGCGDDALETAEFNVMFEPPVGVVEQIDTVSGLQACRDRAALEAVRRHLTDKGYSYECCKITSSSSCASVHL